MLPSPCRFPPDKTTREVLAMVTVRFATHPGSLEHFDWPVTAAEAREALDDFIANRLPYFGGWEGAMWSGEPWLYHSRLSAALNLKLLNPREVVAAFGRAWREKRAPIASVKGFIRQILGWRENVCGIYWRCMPGYLDRNTPGANQPLPAFYWTGGTDVNCLRHTLPQTLDSGYAHHIQRLMVTGLLSLLLGVRLAKSASGWSPFMSMPSNGSNCPTPSACRSTPMAASRPRKPYIASDKYTQRMSNYCTGCRFDPAECIGLRAFPFSALYWDFLLQHEPTLANNPRIVIQVRNLQRLGTEQKAAFREQAGQVCQD